MVKTISSSSSSRVPEQVGDQGMRGTQNPGEKGGVGGCTGSGILEVAENGRN